ncbi:MAG: MBOAT family protein [Lachnospiraceae bacterium]|nr:MBOAT family protein [Lachnospiraceae bacterium]
MVFSSFTFLLVFLPIVLALYYLIPSVRGKNIVLLAASLLFYAWGEPVYVFLMLISIAGNYFSVRFMAEEKARGKKVRPHIAFIVAWNLAMLVFFKYAGMLFGIVNGLFRLNLPGLEISLPIGISFYTFQALSYGIDVYRGKSEYQKDPFLFALYISMFPQLIAGPIVKYGEIEERLAERRVSWKAFGRGAEQFVFGLAKKVLLANTLGEVFERVSATAAAERSFAFVWLGALAFAFQIYFDFSGYSDMACGLGKMFGFDFPENFRYPYTASSVTDFWRRWHISLSSWFRDYVYIPLGGNRVSVPRHILNLLIVWALTGLWHGASFNFLLWGLYYAVWLILEKYVLARFAAKHAVIWRILTLFIVLFGWVLFAFTDFGALGTYLLQMFGIGASSFIDAPAMNVLTGNGLALLAAACCSTVLPVTLYRKIREKAQAAAVVVQVLLFIVCIAFLVYQSYNPFLYFRF